MFHNLKKKISINIFNRRKALKYIFFDKIFSLIILNNSKFPKFLEEFNIRGFAKPDIKLTEEVENLSNVLEIDKTKNGPPFYFFINNNVKSKINSILDKLDKKLIYHLRHYFNSEILPAYICLRRNSFYKKENLNHELYNNNFHNDGYLFTHFKVFINLTNITKECGPMKIVPKDMTRNFLKKINFLDRNNYDTKSENFSYLNTGECGDCLLFDPTNCFHSAGIPEENYSRDYIIVTYVCIPKTSKLINNFKNVDIFKYENNKLLLYAKPKKFSEILKIFFNFYKNKLN